MTDTARGVGTMGPICKITSTIACTFDRMPLVDWTLSLFQGNLIILSSEIHLVLSKSYLRRSLPRERLWASRRVIDLDQLES